MASGQIAGITFPQTPDTLNADYDPKVGPSLSQLEGLVGCYPPEALSNVIAQSIPDVLATSSVTLTAGTVIQTPLWLQAGQVVTNLSIITAATAASTPTNQWAGLASPGGTYGEVTSKVVAISADGLTAPIAADTAITFALSTPYTVPTTGYYIAFVCVAATTGPTAAASVTLGSHGRGAVEAWVAGPGDTGKTTPYAAAATVGETSAAGAQLLVYAS